MAEISFEKYPLPHTHFTASSCIQCCLSILQRQAYPDKCPMNAPHLHCPQYDMPRTAEIGKAMGE